MTVRVDPFGTEKFPAKKIPHSQLEVLIRQFDATMRHASQATRHVYKKGLDQLLAFTKTNGFKFTPSDFNSFRLWLFNGRNLSTNTVNVYLTASRRFCEFLIEHGLLKKNPAWKIHGTKPEFKTAEVNLTEVSAAISSIDRSTVLGKRDFVFLSAILDTGVSISELIDANVGDLKRDGRKARLSVKLKGTHAKNLTLTLPEQDTAALYDYLNARGSAAAGEPLFCALRGGGTSKARLSLRGGRFAMGRRLNCGNDRKIRLDSLRTYCLVRLMSKGKTSKEIRSIMRFKSNMPFRKIMFNAPHSRRFESPSGILHSEKT